VHGREPRLRPSASRERSSGAEESLGQDGHRARPAPLRRGVTVARAAAAAAGAAVGASWCVGAAAAAAGRAVDPRGGTVPAAVQAPAAPAPVDSLVVWAMGQQQREDSLVTESMDVLHDSWIALEHLGLMSVDVSTILTCPVPRG